MKGVVSMIKVPCTCPWCRKETIIECNEAGYEKYMFTRALIQDVFPDMDIHDRETLISGTCRECQDKFFVDDEEDDIDDPDCLCNGECDKCPNYANCADIDPRIADAHLAAVEGNYE